MSTPDNTFPAYIDSEIFRHPGEGWTKAYFNDADAYALAVRDPSTIKDEQYYDHPYHPPFLRNTKTRTSRSSITSEQWSAFLQLAQFHGLSPVDSPTSFALRLSGLLSDRLRDSHPELDFGDVTKIIFDIISRIGANIQVPFTPQHLSLSELANAKRALLASYGDPGPLECNHLTFPSSVHSELIADPEMDWVGFFLDTFTSDSMPEAAKDVFNLLSSMNTRRASSVQSDPSIHSCVELAKSPTHTDSTLSFPSPQHRVEPKEDTFMHPLDPDCPYIDENLHDFLHSIQQFFGFTSDGFVKAVLDYFHCLPGDNIPYNGYIPGLSCSVYE